MVLEAVLMVGEDNQIPEVSDGAVVLAMIPEPVVECDQVVWRVFAKAG